MGETVPKFRDVDDDFTVFYLDYDMGVTGIVTSLGFVSAGKLNPPKPKLNNQHNMPVDCYMSEIRLSPNPTRQIFLKMRKMRKNPSPPNLFRVFFSPKKITTTLYA